MLDEDINHILEKLHQIKGLPRLEIEGCKYPINKELIADYQKSRIPIPEIKGCLDLLPIPMYIAELPIPRNKEEEDKYLKGDEWRWWLEHDGFGGMIGSVNIESEYLQYIDAERGNRCVYVLKNTWERDGYGNTEIDKEFVLFRKSDLVNSIKAALESKDKKDERVIPGKRVIDNVIWEDSIPTGPCARGPQVTDVDVRLEIDLTQEEPKYRINISG